MNIREQVSVLLAEKSRRIAILTWSMEVWMKNIIALTIVLILATTVLFAGSTERPFLGRGLENKSLFDLDNLQMNHSVSFMSGFSSDGGGFYQSVYTNRLFYQFSKNLDLRVDLNFVNHGTANWEESFSFSSNEDNQTNIVPEFSLNYRPSDNTRITIEFRQSVHPHHSSNWRW